MLVAGTKLGPYEIVAPLGAGGMGEVYRAKDTRLAREVAVKVLPQHLSAEPEVRARFEREARTVSSLNHPHICTLFDVGREGETDYLVMELVEGETLAARLARGPLPLAEVLRLGGQIADALDRAHRAGVVHRDLKPANVMVTRGGAKLMDFGLARATGLAGPGSGATLTGLTQSPTIASPLTAEGTIVGTFQYMSPEQLEGKEADARSDLWALGCVLYEMATGRRAFDGRSQASLIAAILSAEPAPLATLAPLAPPALDNVVRSCLVKDPEERAQTAHDVKLQLGWASGTASSAGVPVPVVRRRPSWRPLASAAAGLVLLAAGVAGGSWWQARESARRVERFELRVPSSQRLQGPLRISPQGDRAIFATTDSAGVSHIWMRSFDDLDIKLVAGTEGAGRPFWSPDGRWIGFFSGGKLRKVPTAGGPVEIICDAPHGSDGTWGAKGTILYDGDATQKSIDMVSAGGGVPRPAIRPDTTRGETGVDWPDMLPDGDHFLFLAEHSDAEKTEVRLGSASTGRSAPVMPGSNRVEYSNAGELLYLNENALIARRMDPRSGRLSGDPHTIADDVQHAVNNGMPFFSASRNGVLLYHRGGAADTRQLTWLDRAGHEQGRVLPPGHYGAFGISPDGKRVAYTQVDAGGKANDIWIYDIARDLSERFTMDPGDDNWPVWSRDGRTLYWTSSRAGGYSIYSRVVDGLGSDSLVCKGGSIGPTDVSPDGAWLACSDGPSPGWRVILWPLRGGRPDTLKGARTDELRAKFSPDGRWLAFESNRSGRNEIYVQPFPGPGPVTQVTPRGGRDPIWRRDGKELFFRDSQGTVFAADVKLEPRFEAGLPHQLLSADFIPAGIFAFQRWSPAADGQRFLMNLPAHASGEAMPVLVRNWPALIGR